MKAFLAGLQNATQTSYSNNGITTILGRASQKTLNSQTVIGPALTQFIDVQTIAGFSSTFTYYNPTTNHLFVLGPVSATPTVALFNFNNTTGAYSYVGKITMALGNAAATTYVFRGFTVYESGGLIYPLISATGSVAINGGTYMAWGLSTTDFTVGSTAFFAANTSSQKAVYFLQDSAGMGASNVATTSWGISLPQFSSAGTVNTKVWQWNGTLALPQLFSWDLSGTPSVGGTVLNGISAQTTLYAGTSPAAFFTMGASQNGYVAGISEPVVLQNGTGNVPTGFNAWASGTLQVAASTVYFMRDLQLVSGNWYFNLASTTAGAAITPTSSTSNFTVMRAFGSSSSLFSLKTGVLSSAFGLGAILQADSVGYAKPVSAPANTALNGQDCLYMATTTGLYMGKISDLSSNGTSWASMTFSGINMTGTGIDIVAPAAAFAAYSGQGNAFDVDRWFVMTASSLMIMKPYQNSIISEAFGGSNNNYFETLNPQTVNFGVQTPAGLNVMGGWIFLSSSATGQRGIQFADIYSDQYFANTSVISPVLNTPPATTFFEISSLLQLPYQTSRPNYFIRSASTSSDPIFSVATGGWTQITPNTNLSATTIGPFFQLMALFNYALPAGSPAQINDFVYTCLPPGEQSDHWSVDNDYTTQLAVSPSYVAWYQTLAYSSVVPTLYARVYDTSGNLIFSANTSANPTSFQYSTNGGTSWNNLGTIPNTVGTLIRVLVTPTPAVIASPSIRES